MYIPKQQVSVSTTQKRCMRKENMEFMKEREQKKWILPSLMGDLKPCPIITDPQGCYTGRPLEQSEQPVQDADDL